MRAHPTHQFVVLTSLTIFTLTACSKTPGTPDAPDRTALAPEEEVIYYVFQRSFYDANGDAEGDLAGITEKLPYLQDLGVTSILTTPLYKSIYYHNYFADDFETIDEEYGTRADYDKMIAAIHARGMKYYMDMEPQYVTDRHPWFATSYGNPQSEYSEYLIYNGPDNTKPEPMVFNLTSLLGYDGDSTRITPVNLHNPNVKAYIYDLFRYWVDPNADGNFDDGVDGFRIDHMMDDLDYRGSNPNLYAEFWRPLFDELRAMNPNIRIIAEQADWSDLSGAQFTDADIDYLFNFALAGSILSFDAKQIENAVDTTMATTPAGKYQMSFVENHDTDRFASVVGEDPAKMRFGAAMTTLMKGIPMLYYGQEIGMTGVGGFGMYGSNDGNDIPRREAFEWYRSVDGPGMALWYKDTGPWWEDSKLRDNDGRSVEEELADSTSLLNLYRDLLALRRDHSAFTTGDFRFVDAMRITRAATTGSATSDGVESDNAGQPLAFCRWDATGAYLVVFNTANLNATIQVAGDGLPIAIAKTGIEVVAGSGDAVLNDAGDVRVSLPRYGFSVVRF